jgi:hypothetical protein
MKITLEIDSMIAERMMLDEKKPCEAVKHLAVAAYEANRISDEDLRTLVGIPSEEGMLEFLAAYHASYSPIGHTLLGDDPATLTLTNSFLKALVDKTPAVGENAKWRKIASEVMGRKQLLLAAARDLQKNNVPHALELAATDIFVEKAQRFLTSRGRWLYGCGTATAAIAIGVLTYAAFYLWNKPMAEILPGVRPADWVSPGYIAILALKSTTAGAFLGGSAYFLASLSKALLHEGTVLFSRRHSLRFGRLFVYLKAKEMSREDLEKVFNWNAEFTTAFRDIQTESVAKTPASRLADVPAEVAKTAGSVIETVQAKVTGKK